jgi:glycosyltransferase involved in cell wall biosynthesis
MQPDVTLIAPYPPAGERHGGHSGVASYTANLAHGLAGEGARVAVVAPELDGDPPCFTDGPIEVHRQFRMGRGALPSAARAARRLRSGVVHLQWELFLYGGPQSIPGLFPALRSLGRGRGSSPLVTTLHQVVDPGEVDASYTRHHQVAAPALVARNGLSAVQRAVTWSSAATIVHEESFTGIIPSATVIPHGIETVVAGDRASSRAALGLDDRLVALCFGFVAPYKGVEVLLDAARLAGPDVSVVIAGGEHPRVRGFAADLQARYGDVARFTGYVPDADVSRWFAAADVAVFPYPRPFSSSGALALALAHRTPVLLSPALARCAGAPSAVTVPVDPTALAERLTALASRPDELTELREWDSTLAEGRSWPSVARRHIELYQEVSDVQRSSRRSLRAG